MSLLENKPLTLTNVAVATPVMHNNTWGWANGEQVNSRQNKSTVVRYPPEVGTSKTYLTDVQ